MAIPNWENIQPDDLVEEVKEETLEKPFESSFKYHAVPLAEQMTLDENGTPFTLKELMDLRQLREELDGEG
mgnify:CR=1 FL=1